MDAGADTNSQSWIDRLNDDCQLSRWREVTEEPEKPWVDGDVGTCGNSVTWTNVPPSGCISIPYMAFECPECKEKDERIDGLLESHRDFIDMHNATKREKDAEILQLEKSLEREQAQTSHYAELCGDRLDDIGRAERHADKLIDSLRSALSSERRDNARQRNEADSGPALRRF